MNWYKLAQDRQKGRSLPETGYEYRSVAILRAVPASVTQFNDMDYVTLSMKFAREHAEHGAAVDDEPYHVLRALVPVASVFEAYNPGEYFYSGQPVQGTSVYQADPSQYE